MAAPSTGPSVLLMSTLTVVDRPMRSGWARSSAASRAMRTGRRCTTLIQLPPAFCAGSSEKALPVPADKPTTLPWNSTLLPYMSASTVAGWPTRMLRSSDSLKLASTHNWSSGTIASSAVPGVARAPTCTARLAM